MDKQFCILASRKNGTLYIGVTSELAKRVWQHKKNKWMALPRNTTLTNLYIMKYMKTPNLLSNAKSKLRNGTAVGNCGSSKKQIPHGGICMKILFKDLDSRRSLSSSALVGDGNDASFIVSMTLALP